MKLRYWSYNIPFVYPFTISRGTKTHQPTLIVELEHMGIKGYGEAPAIAYYNIPTQGGFDLWGDFNGIALDSDDSIWMFSMYAKTSHQWGTRGARFHF